MNGALTIYIEIKNAVISTEFLNSFTEYAGSFHSDIKSDRLMANEKSLEKSYSALYCYLYGEMHTTVLVFYMF